MGQCRAEHKLGLLSEHIDEPVFREGDSNYRINLSYLCHNRDYTPDQIVSADMVYPKGAVPNSQLIWIRVELTNGKRQFVTLSLADFHEYIELPESSIGGWTDGDRGSDSAGHFARYAIDDSGSDESVQGEVLDGAEGAEATVET